MLFHATWIRRDEGVSEELDERLFHIVDKWTPPDGMTVHAWVERADGMGGFGLFETDDPGDLSSSFPIFAPFVRFDVVPVLAHADAMDAAEAAIAFRRLVS